MDAPQISGILETILYGQDLPALRAFYKEVVGLQEVACEPGRHLFFRCGDELTGGMLLIFDPRSTRDTQVAVGEVIIPQHGAEGAGHVAFAVTPAGLDDWKLRLEANGVAIESEVIWNSKRPEIRSVYFRDPAGNSIELACPQLWGLGADDPDV